MYFSFFQDGASIHAIIHFIHSHTITANRLWWIIFLTTWFHHDKGCLLESCYWGQSPQKTHQIPLDDAAGCCVCCFFTFSGVLMAFLAATSLDYSLYYFTSSLHAMANNEADTAPTHPKLTQCHRAMLLIVVNVVFLICVVFWWLFWQLRCHQSH